MDPIRVASIYSSSQKQQQLQQQHRYSSSLSSTSSTSSNNNTSLLANNHTMDGSDFQHIDTYGFSSLTAAAATTTTTMNRNRNQPCNNNNLYHRRQYHSLSDLVSNSNSQHEDDDHTMSTTGTPTHSYDDYDDDDDEYNGDDDDDDEDYTNRLRIELPEIMIPGPFVVLQGNAGDGMANTIDSMPIVQPQNVLLGIERERQQPPPAVSAAGRPSSVSNVTARGSNSTNRRTGRGTESTMDDDYHHVASDPGRILLPPPLGQLATSTANNPYARRVVGAGHQAGNEDVSYVVVTDNDDDNTTTTTTTSTTTSQNVATTTMTPRVMIAIEEWNASRKLQEKQQQQDWKESLRQVPTQLLDHCMMGATINNNNNNNNSPDISSTNMLSSWWQDSQTHQVAILRDVPTKLNNGTILRQIIGTMSPGTTIIGRDIIHLHSQTLQRIPTRAQRIINNSDGSILTKVYASSSKGIIQMIQVETREGRTGYACLSLDGYPLLSPGLAHHYINPQTWIWRVTCPAGAFVRDGLDLNTRHINTLPFGSLIQVTRRCINNQGLSRLRTHGKIRTGNNEMKRVNGWCSELLNPLSGQRGIIAQPLPFPVPAIYRVAISMGAVIRQDKELSSPQIGLVPYLSYVKVVGRAFSEHPIDNCVERLQLAGNAGWISVRLNRLPPDDDMVVELIDVDGQFDPLTPGMYHLEAHRAVLLERRQHQQTSSNRSLSSVDENDMSDDEDMDRSTANASLSTTNHHRDNNDCDDRKCVVCLTSARNATIVHGTTGHIACCLTCARILKAQGHRCPVCRSEIDVVIQHFIA